LVVLSQFIRPKPRPDLLEPATHGEGETAG